MLTVRPCEVPPTSLLRVYKDGSGFADCYVVEVEGDVSAEAFIEAFYTSPLFKVERALLGYLASRPATDEDARRLAIDRTDGFSAWRVEGRSPSEILLTDFTGRTRSWLSVSPTDSPGRASGTLLYFGSAVVPRRRKGSTPTSMGWAFHALSGFHRLYSRLLLRSACANIPRALARENP